MIKKAHDGGKGSLTRVVTYGGFADMEKAREQAGQPQAGSAHVEENKSEQRQESKKTTKQRAGGQDGSSCCK